MIQFNYLTFFVLFALTITSLGSILPSQKRCRYNGKCIIEANMVPIRTSNISLLNAVNVNKTCPDQVSVCEDDETCCPLLMQGVYGCCDPDHPRCCGDGVHCCPVEKALPSKQNSPLTSRLVSLSVKTNGSDQSNNVSTVNQNCPGSQFECPPSNTCCKDAQHQWACCNLPDATCCSDGHHCCPHGTQCDLIHARCVRRKIKLH